MSLLGNLMMDAPLHTCLMDLVALARDQRPQTTKYGNPCQRRFHNLTVSNEQNQRHSQW